MIQTQFRHQVCHGAENTIVESWGNIEVRAAKGIDCFAGSVANFPSAYELQMIAYSPFDWLSLRKIFLDLRTLTNYFPSQK